MVDWKDQGMITNAMRNEDSYKQEDTWVEERPKRSPLDVSSTALTETRYREFREKAPVKDPQHEG